jgi:hypothetical protein
MVKDTLRNAMEEDSDGLESTLSEVTDRISFRCILFRTSGLLEETITMVLLPLIEISSTRGNTSFHRQDFHVIITYYITRFNIAKFYAAFLL